MDVSFILSLKINSARARPLLKDGGQAVCLIKPQFEAGREKVGKKGVVRDKAVHEDVVETIWLFAALLQKRLLRALGHSPPFHQSRGRRGNIE